MAHTPGPWLARGYNAGEAPPYRNAQPFSIWIDCFATKGKQYLGGTLAEVYRNGTGSDDPAVQVANARLIAAAPDMLAALKAAREFVKAEPDVRVDGVTLGGDLTTADADESAVCQESIDMLATIDAALAKAEALS